MTKQLDQFTSPSIRLFESETGWFPDCGATADKLHAIGVDYDPAYGISKLALDDVLFNISNAGYWLETVPLECD